jgi:hypothetical protein
MHTPSKLADNCVCLALEAENVSRRRKLLDMAKTWLEIGQLLEEKPNHNDIVHRTWLLMAAHGLIKTPS